MKFPVHAIDVLIFVAYLATLIGIGVYFARRQQTVDEFMRAGSRMGFLTVGLSLMAALNSGIDYVQTPAAVINYGMVFVMSLLSWLVAWPYVSRVTIDFYNRLDVYSAYEYLERRFDVSVRLLAAGIFILWRLAWMGTALYVPCLAINAATDGAVPVMGMAVVLGAVVVVYTMLGGLQAVVWTDVTQFCVMFTGLAVTLATVIYYVPGGFSEILSISSAAGKFDMWAMPAEMSEGSWLDRMALFFRQDVTLVGICLFVAINRFAAFTADQVAIQRFATARSVRDAKNAFLVNAITDTVWMVVLGVVGLGLFSFYQHRGLPPDVEEQHILPYFMSTMFPVGCTGLVIAAISAASLSSVDSAINSTSSIVTVDFYNRVWLGRPRLSEQLSEQEQISQVRVTRWAGVVFGILGTAIACNVGRLGQIYEAAGKMLGAFNGPIFGIFLLGMFSTRAKSQGALIGGFVGLLASCYASFLSPLGWAWIPLVGVSVTVAVGYLVSICTGGLHRDPDSLTFHKVTQSQDQLLP